MGDDVHKNGLYRWQRQTKPKVYSRTQKVATTGDIEDWLQKVEEASSKAAEAVLGSEGLSSYTVGRNQGRSTVKGASDRARIQDEAYNEAQDLLNEWINNKVSLHDDDLQDDPELGEYDLWRKEDLGSRARREWDQLLNGNLENLGTDQPTPRFTLSHREENDPYANLYDLDEDEAVSTVLKNMLDKDFVKETVRRDLGFNDASKYHDPRTKMALRHQQVKENREKREEALKRQRKEAESKKEARLTAKQIVMKEEKTKEMKIKKEEYEIRKQMAQIRKEMQEARRHEAENMLKTQQEADEKARLAREELERQEAEERQAMLRKHQKMAQRKQAKLTQIELEKAKQTAQNLKILHRYFTAWYDMVLHRRLSFGKARAMADWKLTLRVWNAWRSFTRSQRITIETKQHEHNVVEENRKFVLAKKHHYLYQLRKHFLAWRDFVSQEEEKHRLECAQEATRSKMMNLLTAVAEGSLWTNREDREKEEGSQKGRNSGLKSASATNCTHSDAHSASNEVDEMFKQHPQHGSDTPPPSSSRSQSSSMSGKGQKGIPQAWQINRKHAYLSKEELASLMQTDSTYQGDDAASEASNHSDVKVRRRFGTQPWMNRQYTVNNLEHRFTAQQKLLKEQQMAIKEQKRMIEDLVFSKQQQEHHQQLDQISAEKQLALKGGGHSSLPASQPESQQGKGDGSRRDQNAGSRTSLANRPSQPSSHHHTLSDGGDSRRSEVSTARSGLSGTSIATTKTPDNSKYLQVLKNMEDRAAERSRLKAEREEKRRKAEDERLELLKAEEEELKRKAEEEKQARIQAHREKKRLEKQKEQEKQKELDRQRELNEKADSHYQQALMKFVVLFPMKKLVKMSHDNTKKAAQHHNHSILRRVITAWKGYTDELTAEKKQLADHLHGYIVVRRCFRSWKNFKYRMLFLERRAERHHKALILPKVFEAWCQYTEQEKVAEQERLQIAQEFYPRSLQRMVFKTWRRLPQELKREAQREKLRAEMRKKVADLLPDFSPSVSVSQSEDFTL